MDRIPDALFVVDIGKEDICIAEAQKLGVKVFAIVDTDCDPNKVQHIVPGNDDAVRAIKLITSKMADAVVEGTNRLQSNQATDSISEEDFQFTEEPTDSSASVEESTATPLTEPVASTVPEESASSIDSGSTTEEVTPEVTEEQ